MSHLLIRRNGERNRALPLLALVGLSTAGKSTVTQILHARSPARRVRMFTTREPRRDDQADWFTYVSGIAGGETGLVFEGWGGAKYLISGHDVEHARSRGYWPVVDTGDIEPAVQAKAIFGPGYIVLVKRQVTVEQMELVYRQRGMTAAAIRERLDGIESDRRCLEERMGEVDFVLENDGPLAETARQVDRLVEMIHATL